MKAFKFKLMEYTSKIFLMHLQVVSHSLEQRQRSAWMALKSKVALFSFTANLFLTLLIDMALTLLYAMASLFQCLCCWMKRQNFQSYRWARVLWPQDRSRAPRTLFFHRQSPSVALIRCKKCRPTTCPLQRTNLSSKSTDQTTIHWWKKISIKTHLKLSPSSAKNLNSTELLLTKDQCLGSLMRSWKN